MVHMDYPFSIHKFNLKGKWNMKSEKFIEVIQDNIKDLQLNISRIEKINDQQLELLEEMSSIIKSVKGDDK